MTDETYRIARFLARAGVASRRNAEELVRQGRVRVNGDVATDLGRQIDPDNDVVELNDVQVSLSNEEVTFAFHKPKRVVVSRQDRESRKTVYDHLPKEFAGLAARLVYVGRLDFMSEGLLLMTTDGELSNQLTHPSSHVEKEYHVWIDKTLSTSELNKLRAGVDIEGEKAQPCRVEPMFLGAEGGRMSSYRVVLQEGRNRQIRKMMETAGARVLRLVRVRIGALELGTLPVGEWRKLSGKDISRAMSQPGGRR